MKNQERKQRVVFYSIPNRKNDKTAEVKPTNDLSQNNKIKDSENRPKPGCSLKGAKKKGSSRITNGGVFCFTFLWILSGASLWAQTISPELIQSAGFDTIFGTNAMISWSIGEVLIETNAGTEEIVTQGFHQPSYILVSQSETNLFPYEVEIYPNPTEEFIWIKVERDEDTPLDIQLIDISGKILSTQSTVGKDIQIQMDLSQLASGFYLIELRTSDAQFQKTFKIQKI